MSTQQRHETTDPTARVTLAIYGLGCGGGGALTVERALGTVAGVRRVYVNPATEMAYVEYAPTRVSPAQLIAAVAPTGFQAGEPRQH